MWFQIINMKSIYAAFTVTKTNKGYTCEASFAP